MRLTYELINASGVCTTVQERTQLDRGHLYCDTCRKTIKVINLKRLHRWSFGTEKLIGLRVRIQDIVMVIERCECSCKRIYARSHGLTCIRFCTGSRRNISWVHSNISLENRLIQGSDPEYGGELF